MKTASGLLWALPTPCPEPVNAFASDLHPILRQTLATRGVPQDQWASEIEPTSVSDTSALNDLARAAERVALAIHNGETIAVIGDYDVDGACSSALMAEFLSAYAANFLIHIPDRITEGYGPSIWAVEALASQGTSVLITLDCGSSANIPLGRATQLGLDVIVLDHHQVPDNPPAVFALVNPARRDDMSGLERLSAAGITRLFAIALDRLLDSRFDDAHGLDLATLALVADVMPFCAPNRALARIGLDQMNGAAVRPGLSALFRRLRLREAPNAGDLGWKVGPRINAGGRIGDPSLGWRLLATTDDRQAADLAEQLERLNEERRLIEKASVTAAIEAFEAEVDPDCQAIIVHNPSLPPGIAGLVAARLRERYGRPAIALAGIDPAGGSARSVPGVNIGALIQQAVALGIASKGGGHAMAAGLTLPASNIAALRFFIESEIASSPKVASQSIQPIDALATPRDFTRSVFNQVERFGPYANTHQQPIIQLSNCSIENLAPLGTGHMRCEIVSGSHRCRAFAFNTDNTPLHAMASNARGDRIDAVGIMEASSFTPAGKSELRLMDLRKID